MSDVVLRRNPKWTSWKVNTRFRKIQTTTWMHVSQSSKRPSLWIGFKDIWQWLLFWMCSKTQSQWVILVKPFYWTCSTEEWMNCFRPDFKKLGTMSLKNVKRVNKRGRLMFCSDHLFRQFWKRYHFLSERYLYLPVIGTIDSSFSRISCEKCIL